MRILIISHFAPAVLVFIAIAQTPTWADDLLVQVTNNPLGLPCGRTSNGLPARSCGFSSDTKTATAAPVWTSTGNTFSNGPALSSSSATATSSWPAAVRDKNEDISDTIANNVLQFGLNIGLQLNELDPYATRSEIFSPLSVMSALSLLTLGAKGRSYQELKRLIGLDNSALLASNPGKYHEELGSMLNDLQHFNVNEVRDSSNRKQAKWRSTFRKMQAQTTTDEIQHTINVANGLFVQSGYSLNPDYKEIVSSVYDSELTQLDYQRKSREARKHINSWVNDSTHGKIPQIITGEISKSTNIILASVLYFRGFWETSFFPRSTTEDNFYQDGPNSKPIRVQMMATGGVFPFYDAKEYDCRILGLPYKGNETTMYIIQPNNSTRGKLRGLQSILNAHKINEMIDNMAWKTTVMVFPKMHFTRTMNMKNMLQSLGVNDIFQPGLSDLSLIGGGPRPAAAPVAANARLPSVHLSVQQTQGFLPLPTPLDPKLVDRFGDAPLRFTSRFGEIEEEAKLVSQDSDSPVDTTSPKSTDTEDTTSSHTLKKRAIPRQSSYRSLQALANIEADRLISDAYRSDLFVDEIVHKVDFAVDENGTEAAAATLTYLHRSGTDVIFRGDTPFLVVIRHDPTKLPLFYGIINKPEL